MKNVELLPKEELEEMEKAYELAKKRTVNFTLP
jgi:hypothetical protein